MDVYYHLKRGNEAFRREDYATALACYERVLRQAPQSLKDSIVFNKTLAERRLHAQHGTGAEDVLARIQHELALEDAINIVRPHFDADYYLTNNPDVAQAGVDPVLHYCSQGWREGRDPQPGFSTAYYLEANADVREADVCPYWHYIVAGKNEGRLPRPDGAAEKASSNIAKVGLEKPDSLDDYFFGLVQESGLFDPAWYLAHYGEKYAITGNPLAHYLAHGVTLSTNPSPGFDTAYYLKANPDVAASGFHPFLHYLCQGHREGRLPRPLLDQGDLEAYHVEPAQYVPRLPADAPPVEKAVRVIAFYLPQFHPIPENDAWWGEGFTEWTNVRPARPLFEGHYQPHVPDNFLGYYDLRDTSVMRKQIELARQYGIEGFCFYVYWFAGKRLLETPVDNYLADPSLDLPFCICWANENWSRRWDGSEHEILMAQEYSDAHDLEFIADMAKYLRDPRYIRVEDKPLLIVYRPNLFPDMRKTAGRWRQWCREHGLGEICIAYVQSFENSPPGKYGLDAAIEFPPSGAFMQPLSVSGIKTEENFSGHVCDWRALVKYAESKSDVPDWLWRGATPSWDNTPRRKAAGTIFFRNSPRMFERWLKAIFQETLRRIQAPSRRLVFINAWNEWAEGAHLEPDQCHGYAWLNAVRAAHQGAIRPKVLLVSHDAHPHGAQMLCLHIAKNLSQALGYAAHMLVLGEGRLLGKFGEIAVVHRLDLHADSPGQIDTLLVHLRQQSISCAIVNTAVSGLLVPHLKRHGFAVVSLIHELPGILESYKLQAHAQAIAEHADKVVFAAPQVRAGFEAFLGKPLAQAVIRPQGLYQRSWLKSGADKQALGQQVREELGIPPECKIVMCAGYADRRKGFDLFVRIGIEVMQRRPDVYFLWVGHHERGFFEQSLALADEAGLRERFLFTGLVEEPQPYYLASDLYALTSREDPFPSVVMEALDALTPVIAFRDCGGFEALLGRGCGVLVAKEDWRAFAQAVLELLDDTVQAQAMARLGRDIVEQELNFRHYVFDLLALAGEPLPRVSAIVPNYRYARYLHERLKTVAGQTLPLFELIVLDDASPDDSAQVAREFLWQCDLPWRLEVNPANSGNVFRQWRKGLELARGDYVWIAEADDLAHPEFLDRIVRKMEETGAVLGFCDSWQIDENGERLGDSYKPYVNEENPGAFDQSFVIEGREFLEKYLSIKNVILNVSGVVFRRNALQAAIDRIGDELFEYKVAGDWRIYIELCATGGKVVYEAEPMNGHRRHRTSVTHALDAQRHVQEIERMHALSLTFAHSDVVREIQKRYFRKVEQYLNGR